MDVFGNSSYLPNPNNWSPSGFLPGVNSFTATNTTNTFSQNPQSNVPWGISYSQNLPNVVRFKGQSDIHFPYQSSICSLSSFTSTSNKRHHDTNDQPYVEPPKKQLITEEKMAAKMNDMHISTNFTESMTNDNTLQYQNHKTTNNKSLLTSSSSPSFSLSNQMLLNTNNNNNEIKHIYNINNTNFISNNNNISDFHHNIDSTRSNNLNSSFNCNINDKYMNTYSDFIQNKKMKNNNKKKKYDLDDDGNNNNNGNENWRQRQTQPSLYLTEEYKKLSKNSIESIIPECIMNKKSCINNNDKALILWSPSLISPFSNDLNNKCNNDSDDENFRGNDNSYIKSNDPKCNVVITEIDDVEFPIIRDVEMDE